MITKIRGMLITDKNAEICQKPNKIYSDVHIVNNIELMWMADKIAFFYSRASQSDGTAEDALEDKSIGNKNNCKLIPSQKN